MDTLFVCCHGNSQSLGIYVTMVTNLVSIYVAMVTHLVLFYQHGDGVKVAQYGLVLSQAGLHLGQPFQHGAEGVGHSP